MENRMPLPLPKPKCQHEYIVLKRMDAHMGDKEVLKVTFYCKKCLDIQTKNIEIKET